MQHAIRVAAFFVLLAFATPSHAQVYGSDTAVTFTPTVQNAAYSAGNSLGGLQTIGGFFRNPSYSGIFDNFYIVSKGGSTAAMTVYVFNANPSGSTCTDKNAFSLANADIGKLAMAPFVLTPAVIGSGTTATTAQLTQVVSVKNHDSGQNANLYVCIVANATVTPASTSDLVATVSAVLD